MSEEAPPSSPVMRAVFYDGCPGCAMERKLESSQGIPYKEFFFVGITTIASYRRPTCGKKGTRYWIIRWISWVIFNTLFGLSVKYWMAIATRFLLGALNGMLAPIKAYSIEVCRPEHQALGLSIVSTGWGIGLVVGPAIGGYFAQPAKQYPNVFSEKSIFGRYTQMETLHKHKNTEGEIEMIDNSRSTLEEDSHKQKSLYKNWPLISSIIAYCVFTLHDTAYSEIFSLWAVSDKRYGGLSFSSKEVGQVLAVAGAGLLVYQLFIYRSVHKFLGSINSSRIASALSIPILAAYPFMTHLSGLRLGIALYLGTILKGVLSSQSQRGAANGISMTAMSFFKAIAPAGAGALFSWAQERQNAAFFPGDQMIFFALKWIVPVLLAVKL
ncbi:Os12g0132500 [Oryza sativa Japonica Group]|uniref:Os12g0132500 protein n=1 Tax=Oryza sativa subsp. japonica TaxID=39947 RepID=Q0IQB4_ORYSJ|nr:Os12g0132500 [Oryza sativa Japonica Group]|eukprot:NP_001066082.1 Os12g0132500 [Oryza sativa Japonica Group]